jgi:hypothetical protein
MNSIKLQVALKKKKVVPDEQEMASVYLLRLMREYDGFWKYGRGRKEKGD